MEKNWLIRTKSNHILGPVSREKVLELYDNGSIKADDEICSGNGFWFFVREDDMVAMYLKSDNPQGFNPISEAKDVLTAAEGDAGGAGTKDDITLIGSLNISMLNPDTPGSTAASPPAQKNEDPAAPATPDPAESKKKNKSDLKKTSVSRKALKKQNYLQYLAVFCFVVLFLLVYFRKNIIRSLFKGEMTFMSLIISEAVAQEQPSEKKKLTERVVTLDRINFRPSIGLSGLRVSSTIAVDEITCERLSDNIVQLAVILYPQDAFHEKFLLKMRECAQKLPEEHAVKVWLKHIGKPRTLTKDEQQVMNFMNEILNSKFNLITDSGTKNRIIKVISEIKGKGLEEELLKSTLYLMIGNVARSDNLLRQIVQRPPFENWKGYTPEITLHRRITRENLPQIFAKLSKHPSDRKSFELFTHYILEFYNDPSLLDQASEYDPNAIEGKWDLKAIYKLAPEFVRYMRFKGLKDKKKMERLRKPDFTTAFEAYWIWYFFDLEDIPGEGLIDELKRLEREDSLWFTYLLEKDELSDFYLSKTGKSYLAGRRAFLREQIQNPDTFMVSLFKLIDLGDIDSSLVQQTVKFISND